LTISKICTVKDVQILLTYTVFVGALLIPSANFSLIVQPFYLSESVCCQSCCIILCAHYFDTFRGIPTSLLYYGALVLYSLWMYIWSV